MSAFTHSLSGVISLSLASPSGQQTGQMTPKSRGSTALINFSSSSSGASVSNSTYSTPSSSRKAAFSTSSTSETLQTSSSAPSSYSSGDSSGLSPGAIAGIAVGGVSFTLLLLSAFLLWRCKKKRGRSPSATPISLDNNPRGRPDSSDPELPGGQAPSSWSQNTGSEQGKLVAASQAETILEELDGAGISKVDTANDSAELNDSILTLQNTRHVLEESQIVPLDLSRLNVLHSSEETRRSGESERSRAGSGSSMRIGVVGTIDQIADLPRTSYEAAASSLHSKTSSEIRRDDWKTLNPQVQDENSSKQAPSDPAAEQEESERIRREIAELQRQQSLRRRRDEIQARLSVVRESDSS